MPETFLNQVDLESLARRVGTPFYVYSAEVLRRRIADITAITPAPRIQARYAVKACSNRHVLEVMRESGIWIDAVSGNEILRAKAAGFAMGSKPPVVLFTADVFRHNALDVICNDQVMPNVGSPGMIDALRAAGHRGPIGVRLNPGFGHGHVRATDTGGPSSKHGIWHEEADAVQRAAKQAGYPIVLLHAHVGSGPSVDEFIANMNKLAHFFSERVADYPDLEAVSLGGGIPHRYRPEAPEIDLAPVGKTLAAAQELLSARAGRQLRLEIEPGRYFVAPSAALVTRVTDEKVTRSNDKGPGHAFVMVDAGFSDLIRPAMYGSYHHITVHGATADRPPASVVVAGPLCESGDVFTRSGGDELLQPRDLPQPRRGDLLVLHDAGAYGYEMSSFYISSSRPPQVWLENGRAFLMSRRDTVEDIVRNECFEPIG